MKGAGWITPARDRAAALARLRPVERRAVDGATVEQMAEGCTLLDLIEGGQPVGAVAVELRGDVATIKAAATRGADTWGELEQIERALRRAGARWCGMFTRRPALVRRLERAGYSVINRDGAARELLKRL